MHDSTAWFSGGLFLYLLFYAGFTAIPAIVAIRRKHKNRNAIIALVVLAGWTCVGWVIALVWSLTDNSD